jgi:hypothetical protein
MWPPIAWLEEKRGDFEAALMLAKEAAELQRRLRMKTELDMGRELLDRLERKLMADRNVS